ncbi:hypothetical protein ID866_6507 [Astraeus odoratus]|nr:hypothetical protein ID866_6507 [Astraeus odoratus]
MFRVFCRRGSSLLRGPTKFWVISPTLYRSRNASSSSYTTAFLDAVQDVGHPARHLSYPKAIPLYEQLKPIPSVRYTKSLLFITALVVSLAMDLTWRYWPQKATTVIREDGAAEDVYEPRPISHRLLMLSMHLGVGASIAAYLVNKRRLHVHKLWILPKNVRKRQGKSSHTAAPEMLMDVLVKTYSWHSPRFSFTYRSDIVQFTPCGENIVLRIVSKPDTSAKTFFLRAKGALVNGKAVRRTEAKELILNSIPSSSKF